VLDGVALNAWNTQLIKVAQQADKISQLNEDLKNKIE